VPVVPTGQPSGRAVGDFGDIEEYREDEALVKERARERERERDDSVGGESDRERTMVSGVAKRERPSERRKKKIKGRRGKKRPSERYQRESAEERCEGTTFISPFNKRGGGIDE
jgi:hypothetical protein